MLMEEEEMDLEVAEAEEEVAEEVVMVVEASLSLR
jgi:hypothetical protein